MQETVVKNKKKN